jgi:hypothetical protein
MHLVNKLFTRLDWRTASRPDSFRLRDGVERACACAGQT